MDKNNNNQTKQDSLINAMLEIEKYKYSIMRLLLSNIAKEQKEKELIENIKNFFIKLGVGIATCFVPVVGDLLSNIAMDLTNVKLGNETTKQIAKIEKIIDKNIIAFNKKNNSSLKTIETAFNDLENIYSNDFSKKEFTKLKGYVQTNAQILLLEQHENEICNLKQDVKAVKEEMNNFKQESKENYKIMQAMMQVVLNNQVAKYNSLKSCNDDLQMLSVNNNQTRMLS